jgi:hypothetical protein
MQKWKREKPQAFAFTAEDEPLITTMKADFQTVLKANGKLATIAAELEIPLGTVKSRLNRARQQLAALREQELQKRDK